METGLLSPTDWTADLITADSAPEPEADGPARLFRREFDLEGRIASARLYLTAHGVVAAEINGAAVGSDVLTPGWTSYRHRLRYVTYDVTDLRAFRRRMPSQRPWPPAGSGATWDSRAACTTSTATGSACWPSSR